MELATKDQRPRGIFLLPNLFTIGALFAGFYAIVATLKGNFESAAFSIFIAMIMDALDGRVARLTNTMTAFGAELDSLSDMVCFAVAPALLIYSSSLCDLGKYGWITAFIYTVAVALRLARFNTQLGKFGKRYFQGLPCPAGAAVITSIVWSALDLEIATKPFAILLAIITILISIFMVSNIRYRSFKDIDFKNNVSFVYILLVVLIVVLVSIYPSLVLFSAFTGYAFSGPIVTIWGLRQRKLARKANNKNGHKS
jgi:CDP-diacylglycerol---serine O-phosphatidyltransferase